MDGCIISLGISEKWIKIVVNKESNEMSGKKGIYFPGTRVSHTFISNTTHPCVAKKS